ncbi:MAG: TIGR02281 family clan AA aspartic protease [Candidatus Binatia bacterium]
MVRTGTPATEPVSCRRGNMIESGFAMRDYLPKILRLCLLLALTGQSHAGDFYRWVDQNGVVHFTDNLHNIPEKQRQTATRIQNRESPRDPEPAKPPAPSKASIPIQKNGAIVIVDAKLNGKTSAKLIVDTGASYTMISTAMAKELGIDLDGSRRTVPFHTANGIIQAPLADLESITVGGMEVKNLTAAIHDALPNTKVAGLLGLNFLSNFRMDIDTEKGVLHLEKK